MVKSFCFFFPFKISLLFAMCMWAAFCLVACCIVVVVVAVFFFLFFFLNNISFVAAINMRRQITFYLLSRFTFILDLIDFFFFVSHSQNQLLLFILCYEKRACNAMKNEELWCCVINALKIYRRHSFDIPMYYVSPSYYERYEENPGRISQMAEADWWACISISHTVIV